MAGEREPQQKKPLVSVERQWEKNILTGKEETRMFVKMYFEARDSGLLGHMPAELWQTLCALATYMDESGFAFPSQELLARDLSISRQQANIRLKRLAAYRFNGAPVISVRKTFDQRGKSGRWVRNTYRVESIAGLGIFEDRRQGRSRGEPTPVDSVAVSGRADTGAVPRKTDKARTDSAPADKNKSHLINQTRLDGSSDLEGVLARRLVAHFHKSIGSPESRQFTRREIAQAVELITRLGEGKAYAVIDFAVREATSTNFQMRVFGAVLQYEPDALDAHARAQKRLIEKAQKEREQRLADLEFRYSSWRTEETKRRMEEEDSEEVSRMSERARTRLLAQGWKETHRMYPSMLDRFLVIEFAERYRLPDFETWYKNEYPVLRRSGLA